MLGLSHNWAMAEDGAVLAGHYLGYCDYSYIALFNFFLNRYVFQYNSHYDTLPCHGCAISNFPSKSIFLLWTQEKFFKNCFSSSLIRHWIFFQPKKNNILSSAGPQRIIHSFFAKNRRMGKINFSDLFRWRATYRIFNKSKDGFIKLEVKQNLNYLWVNKSLKVTDTKAYHRASKWPTGLELPNNRLAQSREKAYGHKLPTL